jgi:hypothetical protein
MVTATLTLLPILMLLACVALLVRLLAYRSYSVSPGFCALILMTSARCIVFLAGMWRTATVLTRWAPVFMLLAAEESVLHVAVMADNPSRMWRHRFCLGIGLMFGAVSLLSGEAAEPWRAALQMAACGMLAASILHSNLWGWGCFTDRGTTARQWLLLLYFGAAIVSSIQPIRGPWWVPTLITEGIQLATLIGFQFALPWFASSSRTILRNSSMLSSNSARF